MNDIAATRIIGANPANGRSEMDFYPTPPEATIALLDFLNLEKSCVIWEPACGEMDMAEVIQQEGYSVIATDLRTGHDFLTAPMRDCDWIITNPPFSVADKFIERCAEHGKPFALLLKSQYWHAAKRTELFRKIKPSFVLPLTWRPNFLFKKKSKASPLMDVMWCVWEPPYASQNTIYYPLERGKR